MKRIISVFILCAFFAFNLFAQENLLRQLIDLPAPPPVAKTEDETDEKSARSKEFYDDKNIPPDDAPIDDVIDYWKRKAADSHSGNDKALRVSAKNAARLLEQFAKEPEKLSDFLKILPDDSATAETVKDIFDVSQNAEGINENWRKQVKNWLKFNAKFYIDELAAEVSGAKDEMKYGSVTKQDELIALTKLDWEIAEPILKKLENGTANPRTSALAKTLLYKNALAKNDSAAIEKYRDELKEILSNRNLPANARDIASDALFETEWQGQDDYYLSSMEDETLLFPQEGNRLYSPLTTLTSKNPDKWIPILAKLIGNKNRAVHNAAVQSLMEFENRKDALEPLLSWLSDPNWADIDWSPGGRTTYMQLVADVDLPESVPGLIWIVENEDDEANWAARSLGKYKDARAIPSLKNALYRIGGEDTRQTIIDALIDCNGLTDDEQMSALEFYADFMTKPENIEKIKNLGPYDNENPLPVAVSVGRFLAEKNEPSEGLILRAIERIKFLEKEKPDVAKILSGMMAKWQGRLIDLEMIDRIESGRADVEMIVNALARRKELKERVANELYAMRGKSGLPGALAACLLEDENEVLSAFRSQNLETQIATLACARLLRKPLPIREVGDLLNSNNKFLALAAERYLESEDSLEARNLVLAKHPNEALILGARDSFNPAKMPFPDDYDSPLRKLFWTVSTAFSFSSDFSELERSEKELRKEIIENQNLIAIYAHLPNHDSGQRVVRIYKDHATFTYYEDKARYREKKISKEELEKFLQTLREIKVDEFSPKVVNCHHDCYVREFITLSRNGGRRIFSGSGIGSLGSLGFIEVYFTSGKYQTRYHLQDKINGLEILFANERYSPQAIWKTGDDFRVLVEDKIKEEEISEAINQQDKLDEANENLDHEIRLKDARKRRAERAFEHYEWRKFSDGKLGERIDEPAEIPFLRDKLTFPAMENLHSNNNKRQAFYGNYEIRVGEYNAGGLWKINRVEQTELKKGEYANPIVSGSWVIVSKTDESWSDPNYVVRINLQTGKESKINLPPAHDFKPVAFVPAHNKVLLYRDAEPDSPKPAEYYLLDANTGKTELVKGEFRPLTRQTFRPLQMTGNANEFWAAIYDEAKNQTEIGHYDAKNFTFKAVLAIPKINLNSMQIWVDEKESKVYFVYQANYFGESHLLSLPLK